MRLLHAQTTRLVEFPENEIPEYAILSHTWEKDEVLFQDIQGPRVHTKAGYKKIQHCCREALDHGLEYAWVDTCCIDKSSSAELSEAINSMHRWYKNARVCYVYLVDVFSSPVTPLEDTDSQFAKSRWFTRGWTLQELLAPAELYFFSSNWSRLGTKNSLIDILSQITKIESTFLLGEKPVDCASIAKRMSWASERVTTRVEDIAYCLLGIFGVNMPLLYGEGNNAFIRLQEEIMRVSDDQSLFAWGEPEWAPMPLWGSRRLARPATQLRGLFARSPAEFSTCGNIISDEVAQVDEPYTLTNKGVRLIMSVYTDDSLPDNQIAILACRPEDSLLQILAMPLRDLGGGQFARGVKKPIVIARDHVRVLISRTIYLRPTLREHQSQVSSISPFPGFWIRTFPSYSRAHHILKVEPASCWDPRNRLVSAPSSPLDEGRWYATIWLGPENSDGERTAILIGFSNGYPWCHLVTDSTSMLPPGNVHELLFHNGGRMRNQLGSIKVEVGEEKLLAMGIRVRVVDITVVSTTSNRVGEMLNDKPFSE